MNSRNKQGHRQVILFRSFFAIICIVTLLLVSQSVCFATTVTLQWDAVTDQGLAGYKVYYQADSSVQPFTGTGATQGVSPVSIDKALINATISGLDPAHAYYFAVTSYNTSGVESAYSNTVYVPELVSPTIAIGAPANNASVSGTVSVTASGSDNVGVTKVEFYVNNVLMATDTATPYVYSWNTSSLAAGTYTLMAKAYDAAGNVGQSGNVSVTVVNDTTLPVVVMTAPVSNVTVAGVVTITATASDNVGVSKVELYENGTLLFAGNVPPYSYNWNTTSVVNGSYSLTAMAYDNAGNIGQSSVISVTVFNDTASPTVTAFTMPAASSSTTVAISSFTATDNAVVTGYQVTESAIAPAAGATGWSASIPTSFTFSAAGSKIAYAWAKDAAGNVSLSRSAAVAITLPDTTAPVVSTFTIPSTATTLIVAVSTFSATDAVGVTGYLITESATIPAAGATGWSATAPTNVTFGAAGSKTAYAWAKDAAGNVSLSRSAAVTITLPDTIAPVVTAFTMPTTSNSLIVAVSSLTATDVVGVTGYLINSSATTPLASATGWSTSTPTSVVYTTAGSKIAYAWAKDAAGNVSLSRSAAVTITLPDTTAPVVSITSPVSGATLVATVIVAAAAADNVGVAKVEYYVNGALHSSITSAPYNFTWNTITIANGSYTLSSRAYDAAGNVAQSAAVVVVVNNIVTPPSGTYTAVFGSSTGTNFPGTVEDTYLNINSEVNATSTVLNTYTWPTNTPANAIVMKWNLSALPANAQIQSATLSLYMTGGGGDAQYEMPVSAIINKLPVIANSNGYTYDGTNAWTASSVPNGGIPLAQSDIGLAADAPLVDMSNGYKSWNVTNIVKDWAVMPSNNKGLLLNSSNKASSDSNRIFASSEAVDAGQRPKLVVTYILVSDTTPPTVSIGVRKDITAASGMLSVTATASDNVGVSRVEFFVNGVLASTATTAPYVFNWDSTTAVSGSNSLMVKAYDAAGNSGLSPSIRISVPSCKFK